ncbi:peptidase M48-like protein [Actinokineospora auranticolor]|uniref:Peptidase M48-like protein n=2 Tax=Actinokineospora auranticolor TaxID=155976 RepID=A0A2S6GK12_9PSEU|nr:peptidase M48-like protein [Actinokineospora auranticolor]
MSEAEELYSALKEGLEPPGTVGGDEVAARELGRRVEANLLSKVWSSAEWGLPEGARDITFTFEEPVAQSMQQGLWDSVLEFIEAADVEPLTERTIVRTLDLRSADAFATSAGDEHLIVVNSTFHDVVYNFAKLAAIGSDPRPADGVADPTWRRGPSGARYDVIGRLLRLMLGLLRWNGEFTLAVRVSCPLDLTRAAAQLTEFIQASVLAHEAGHIALGHLRTSTRGLHVGGHEAPLVDLDHTLEYAADVYGVTVLARLVADRFAGTGRAVDDALGEVLYCQLLLLDLYQDAFFVVPAASHPTPVERLAHLGDHLPAWTLGIDPQDFDPRRANFVIPVIAAAECRDARSGADDPFEVFMADVLAAPYFTLTPQYASRDGLEILMGIDHAENLLGAPRLDLLTTIAERFLGAPPLTAVPGDLVGRLRAVLTPEAATVDTVTDVPGFVDALIAGEVGAALVMSGAEPFASIRDKCWSPAPGTPFHRWCAPFSAIGDFELRMALVALSFHVARAGETRVWVLGGGAQHELGSWVTERIALRGTGRA